MLFMNEHEVREAAHRYRAHPTLGPATRTLAALVEWTNCNSDGWPYWPKPCRAARALAPPAPTWTTPNASRSRSRT
jgi:hypothetical protein